MDKSESAIGNIAFAIRLSSFQDSFPWIQQRVVKVQSGLTLKNCQMEKLLAKRFYIHIGDGPDFLLKMRKFG